jgi:NAD(P)H-hydrate epimerase
VGYDLVPGAVVVDALFGTGLDRAISGVAADLVNRVNAAAGAYRVALDVPSGLNADTGVPLGPTVQAERTLTFAYPKLGLLTPRGRRYAGALDVIGLGVPGEVPPEVGVAAHLLERNDVASWITRRAPDAHKYAAGHVAILAGSAGKTGAALLVAHGALRAGAGAATIATWPDTATALETRVTEVMCARLDADDVPGSVDRALRGKHSVVLGPGFGLDDMANVAIEHVIASWRGPIVIDADAITQLANDPSVALRGVGARVLTPHAGELARLLGTTAAEVEDDRFGAVAAAAKRTGSVVLLKGAHSVVCDPSGRMAIDVLGTPALATAGSGDCLAGIIGALACSLGPFEAACAGAWLHATAGERWSSTHGDRGLLASEIADQVPYVLKELLA